MYRVCSKIVLVNLGIEPGRREPLQSQQYRDLNCVCRCYYRVFIDGFKKVLCQKQRATLWSCLSCNSHTKLLTLLGNKGPSPNLVSNVTRIYRNLLTSRIIRSRIWRKSQNIDSEQKFPHKGIQNHARIMFSLTWIFPYEDRIFASGFMQWSKIIISIPSFT